MTKDEIISMAKEAWLPMGTGPSGRPGLKALWGPELERFAALVEAKAAEKEREACAKLVERLTERKRWIRGVINGESTKPCELASAIRARSAKGDPHG